MAKPKAQVDSKLYRQLRKIVARLDKHTAYLSGLEARLKMRNEDPASRAVAGKAADDAGQIANDLRELAATLPA